MGVRAKLSHDQLRHPTPIRQEFATIDGRHRVTLPVAGEHDPADTEARGRQVLGRVDAARLAAVGAGIQSGQPGHALDRPVHSLPTQPLLADMTASRQPRNSGSFWPDSDKL